MNHFKIDCSLIVMFFTILIIVTFTLCLLIVFSLFIMLYVFYNYHFFGEIKMYIFTLTETRYHQAKPTPSLVFNIHAPMFVGDV